MKYLLIGDTGFEMTAEKTQALLELGTIVLDDDDGSYVLNSSRADFSKDEICVLMLME